MRKQILALPTILPDKIEILPEIHLLFTRRTGNYVTSSKKAWNALFEFIHENQLEESTLRYFGILHDNPYVTAEENYDSTLAL